MSKTTMMVMAGVLGFAATMAAAQTPLPLLAPSFETPNPLNPAAPDQFTNNGSADARYRSNTDGLTPAVTARTGERCLELRPPSDNGFAGFTTDTRNFFAAGFPFYDPVFDWSGGDVEVRCWYMIPANSPIDGAPAAIKFDIKGAGNGNQNNATLDPWGVTGPWADRVITGHTNGQWVEYVSVWTQAQIQAEVLANVAEGYFNVPPYPNRIKITFGRFGYGTPGATGTIFWDDLSYRQIPPGPQCAWNASGCPFDQDGDGDVDSDDIVLFFGNFENGDECGDMDADGDVDSDDVVSFFGGFENGGC